MSKPTGGAGHEAAKRRLRYGLSTLITIGAATATCVLLAVLAAARPARLDVTATREHTLAPRTRNMLARLTEPHEIVIVADAAAIDPRARRRMDDVLAEFDRASEMVRCSAIDASSTSDRGAYAALLDRLVALHQKSLDEHVGAANAAMNEIAPISRSLNLLAERLTALYAQMAPTDPRRGSVASAAGVARAWIADLERVTAIATAAMSERIAGSMMPAIDAAEQALVPALTRLSKELETLRAFLEPLTGAEAPDAAREPAIAAVREAAALRDASARAADGVQRLRPLQLSAIVRTFEAGPAAVIVAPGDATAVQFSALFPAGEDIDLAGGRQADLRFSGEELLATAIGALNNPSNPILVLIHGSPERLLDDAGVPVSQQGRALLGRLLDRLRLRGVDVVEWSIADGGGPPSLSRVDAEGVRPVVYVTLGLSAASAEGAQRIGAMAEAIDSLIEGGKSVLLSVEPSTLPAVGERDPLVACAEAFGLHVDSGRPLLRRQSSPRGPVVSPGHTSGRADEGHAVGGAASGLMSVFAWPVAIERVAPEQSGAAGRSWTLLALPASDDVWGESQWLEYRSLTGAQRSMIANPPTPDAKWDNTGGPWTVAAAAERPSPTTPGRTQRLVIVGANGWFFDEFTQASRVVDGRTVTLYPANAELFEAALFWLAGQDEMIAPSPEVGRVSRIAELSSAQLTAVRWAVIAGLPAGVLLIGVALRLVRG